MSDRDRPFQTLDDFEKEINYERSIYEDLVVEVACERVNMGLTQQQLADALGTTQSVISRFENLGRNPSLDFLNRVASALGHKLCVTIFGEYCHLLTAEQRESVERIAETRDESKQEIIDRLFSSSLRHLEKCIKWTKIENVETNLIEFPDSEETKLVLANDFDKRNPLAEIGVG